MTTAIFILVLLAALLHASWNIIVKGGSNKLFETAINALGGGIAAICLSPYISLPQQQCWILLLASCICHLLYYFCIAITYKYTDLSLGYAVMRGTAPIITALTLSIFGIALNPAAWVGILFLCLGIFILGFQHRHAHNNLQGLLFALCTSLIIASYTITDGFGARLAGDSLNYTCWLFFLNIFPIQVYALTKYRNDYLVYLKKRLLIGIVGGFCSFISYGIAIWAMTRAPIALIGALRETSVIFGMILAVIFLHEKLTFKRIIAIIFVCIGAITCRIG